MVPDALRADAMERYQSPGRAYHTWLHIEEVEGEWRRAVHDLHRSPSLPVELAILYHDAVYLPGRHDNEAVSAELARAAIANWMPGVDAERVAQLILLTARHGKLTPADVDEEAALFLDCDMAILGAAAARYDQYERAVAVEYSALPPEVFAAGRRQFLQSVLATPRIFLSEYFHARLDAAARDNLRRALG